MADLCRAMEQFGKGIGSVPRYRIIEALFAGPRTVGEIAGRTKLSQPLVSQHLRVLKGTGLVRSERRGREVLYSLNVEYTMTLLRRLADALRSKGKATAKGRRQNTPSRSTSDRSGHGRQRNV